MKKPQLLLLAGSLLTLGAGGSLLLTQANHDDLTTATVEVVQEAPAPSSQFVDYLCLPPQQLPQDIEVVAGSWYAPVLEAGASFSPSDYLPAESLNDTGIIYGPSEAIESPQGASLLVGHVDLQPGVKSPKGGELTPWGKLHQLKACDVIYTRAADGTLVISQVTSMIVADQFDAELEAKAAAAPNDVALAAQLHQQQEIQARIFRSTGDKSIVLLTCSGPSVADVGRDFQFRYANNLIVETKPINL